MTKEDALKNAVSLLGVTFPIDAQEFKTAYRRACFIYHPDRKGSEEQFKKIQEIYQLVKNDSSLIHTSNDENAQLADGIPISSLGMGLGPTTNGIDCKECETRGYTISFEQGWGECPTCGGTGQKSSPCRACKGTGKFKLRNGREVECRDCKGSRRFTQKPRVNRLFNPFGFYSDYCSQCRGNGRVIVDNKFKPHYSRCCRCEGAGEIPIYNPVIPKGSLGFKKKGR